MPLALCLCLLQAIGDRGGSAEYAIIAYDLPANPRTPSHELHEVFQPGTDKRLGQLDIMEAFNLLTREKNQERPSVRLFTEYSLVNGLGGTRDCTADAFQAKLRGAIQDGNCKTIIMLYNTGARTHAV